MDHPQAVSTLATERYLLGEMTEQERDAFEAHYFDCAECAEDVRTAALMTGGARAGLIGAPRVVPFEPRTTARRPSRFSVALPWAVAATLAVAVGYQSVTRGTGVPTLTAPVALDPITLRPASRGEDAVVTLPPSGGAVTLALAIGGTNAGVAAGTASAVQYTLRTAASSTVASGSVASPQPGAPLLLLVPANLLTPGEHYVLVLANSADQGLTPDNYRFTVKAR